MNRRWRRRQAPCSPPVGMNQRQEWFAWRDCVPTPGDEPTRILPCPPCSRRVPHARGDEPRSGGGRALALRCVPHARGDGRTKGRKRTKPRVFPTPVGMNRRDPDARGSVPHARGMNRHHLSLRRICSSVHARGDEPEPHRNGATLFLRRCSPPVRMNRVEHGGARRCVSARGGDEPGR